jgi:hypothetical protein
LYAETVKEQDLLQKDPNVVGGPASVEMIDREGHLITTNALNKAFTNYMKNPMTRNVMVMHSDIQVGWALPAYISKSGQIYKSGIGDNTLFFITELRDDTKISKRVVEEIKKSRMKSYSIAGSAIRTENVSGNMFKGEPPYMRVDELELAEVTICEKGVNQGAGFDIIKGSRPTKSCADESCFISKNEDHSHKQETQTMSFDEYKNLLTSRDGKSFAKMFSEYTYVYKGRGPLDRVTGGRAKVEWNTQSPLNPKGNPKLINPKNVVELQITPKKDIKKSLLSMLLKEMTDHKKAAWEKFKVGQKAAKKTEKEARANFERSYNPDRPNKSAAPKAATGKRAKIDPAANTIPAKQLRGRMTERYMAGHHSPQTMKNWMAQYKIDPRNIPHHGHMVLSSDQHEAATKQRQRRASAQQAQYTPKASSPEAPRPATHTKPVKISEEGAPPKTDMFGQPVTDSDTKKAMKTDMLHTLLGIEKGRSKAQQKAGEIAISGTQGVGEDPKIWDHYGEYSAEEHDRLQNKWETQDRRAKSKNKERKGQLGAQLQGTPKERLAESKRGRGFISELPW